MPNLKERIRGLWHRADTPADPAHATLTGEDSFADDSNEFALAMYSQLRRRPGNLFFSPLSIRTALGMACAGARNETSAQMRHVLRFPPDGDQIHQAVGKFVQRLSAAGNGASGITVANSLWAHDRSLPVPHF